MPRIIMNHAFIAHWTRMRHFIGRLSASASSHHSLSSVAFITNIAESDFRHAQRLFRLNGRDQADGLGCFWMAAGADCRCGVPLLPENLSECEDIACNAVI